MLVSDQSSYLAERRLGRAAALRRARRILTDRYRPLFTISARQPACDLRVAVRRVGSPKKVFQSTLSCGILRTHARDIDLHHGRVDTLAARLAGIAHYKWSWHEKEVARRRGKGGKE